jgi:hypothetical protein
MSNTVEGEVVSSVTEPSPRDVALKAYQDEFSAKHTPQIADFLLSQYAVISEFKRLLEIATTPRLTDSQRAYLALQESQRIGRLLTDVIITVAAVKHNIPNEPTKEEGKPIPELLTLAKQHHDGFQAIGNRFGPDGEPLQAANDVDTSSAVDAFENEGNRIIIPS